MTANALPIVDNESVSQLFSRHTAKTRAAWVLYLTLAPDQ